MKHIGTGTAAFILFTLPLTTFAQAAGLLGGLQTVVDLENNTKILEMVSLWSALIIAFATSAMVWLSGRKMRGGVFGKVLNFFSLGMLLVFLGFVTNVPWFHNFDQLYVKMVHDSLYIIGYIFMGIAASNLLKVIKGE